MKTLKELYIHIEHLMRENPGYAQLPLVYAADDEGNSYHPVHNFPSEFLVEELNKHYLEPGFEYDIDLTIKPFKPNCIIIN